MMNRIQKFQPGPRPISVSPEFDSGASLFAPATHGARYSLFAPLHYEPGYAYPLLVWLHGSSGSDERQLLRIMPHISSRNYVAVAPRGLLVDGGHFKPTTYDWPQEQEHFQEADERISCAIEAAMRRLNVAKMRVFLAGFDSGGTMAFRIALTHPRHFAGVLSICGRFPRNCTPLGQLVDARRIPVFLALGRDSQRYAPDEACDDLRLLHTAGMSITLRQYPCDHALTLQMLRDVDRWIMDRITAPKDSPVAASDL